MLCPICQAKSDPRCAACSRREAIITAAQVISLKLCYRSLQAAAISSGLKRLVLQDRPGPWLWTAYLVPTVQATFTAMHLIFRHRESSLRLSLRYQNSTILMPGGGWERLDVLYGPSGCSTPYIIIRAYIRKAISGAQHQDSASTPTHVHTPVSMELLTAGGWAGGWDSQRAQRLVLLPGSGHSTAADGCGGGAVPAAQPQGGRQRVRGPGALPAARL